MFCICMEPDSSISILRYGGFCFIFLLFSFELVLPFWYRLSRVVLDKGPLNGCVCVLLSSFIVLTFSAIFGPHFKQGVVTITQTFSPTR